MGTLSNVSLHSKGTAQLTAALVPAQLPLWDSSVILQSCYCAITGAQLDDRGTCHWHLCHHMQPT